MLNVSQEPNEQQLLFRLTVRKVSIASVFEAAWYPASPETPGHLLDHGPAS